MTIFTSNQEYREPGRLLTSNSILSNGIIRKLILTEILYPTGDGPNNYAMADMYYGYGDPFNPNPGGNTEPVPNKQIPPVQVYPPSWLDSPVPIGTFITAMIDDNGLFIMFSPTDI